MVNDVKYPVNAGFFNAINEDRSYSAEDMNRPYKKLISNGVFATPRGTASNDLQVLSADNGMNVIVSKGDAIIGDKWFENPRDLTITILQNPEVLPRIDSIIAQIDRTQDGRTGSIVYRQGSASSNPVHPKINTDEDIFEMRLADIRISPSCVKITQDLIIDRRGSKECPWITSLIYQVDTSTLYDQWQAAYKKYYENQEVEHNEYFNEFKNAMESFFSQEEQSFETWFNQIKSQLSEDAAGSLQLEIDKLNESLMKSIRTISTEKVEKLIIKDACPCRVNINVYGKTEQEKSITDKNKFQIGERTENTVGVNSIVNLSEITLEGTTTENGNLTVGHNSTLSGYDYIGKFEAGTYYFSKFVLGGSWTQNEEASTFACYLRDANKTALCNIGGTAESGTSKKIVLEEETDLYIQIYCNGANTIFNNYKLGFQLEKDKATSYEKYIKTMPSTEFPSKIRNIGDNLNIFDGELEVGAISTTTGELTTNNQRQRSKNFIKVKGNTSYVMTVDNELISLNRMFYDKDYHFISSTTLTNFKTPSTARYMKFYGASDLADAKIKIQEGTIATPYTPYNCGSINLKKINDNLYNVNADNKRDDNTTVDKDGWITMINNNTEGTTVKNAQLYKRPSNDIKPSTDYYLVTEIKEVSGNVNVFALTGATTSSNKSQFKTECQPNWNTLSSGQVIINKITTRDDFSDCVVFLRTLLQTNVGQSASITFRMSLFEDEITKDSFIYKKYKEKIIQFPLSEGQILHEDDYLAEDGIHQEGKTPVFDGTEKWVYYNNGNVRVFYTDLLRGLIKNEKYLCSHFKNGNYNSNNNVIFINQDGRIHIRIDNIVSVDEFKTFLAEQYTNGTPVTIKCKCENETIIPYTKEQKEAYKNICLMYEGYNKLVCTDEIKPNLKCEYYYNNDLNKSYTNRFDNVEEKIEKLEDNYSTEERIVGTWTNGKPLYEKTIFDTCPVVTTEGKTSFKFIDVSDDIDTSFIKEGYFKYRMRGSETRQPMPIFPIIDDSGKYYRVYLVHNKLVVETNAVNYNPLDFCAVVRYTKTKD